MHQELLTIRISKLNLVNGFIALIIVLALFALGFRARKNNQVALAGAPVASQTRTSPIAAETRVWKTITVGDSKGVNAVRKAMEAAPCPIAISDDADEILGRPAFPFIKQPVDLDLVVLSVFELGFGAQAARTDVALGASAEVSLRDIYARAVSMQGLVGSVGRLRTENRATRLVQSSRHMGPRSERRRRRQWRVAPRAPDERSCEPRARRLG